MDISSILLSEFFEFNGEESSQPKSISSNYSEISNKNLDSIFASICEMNNNYNQKVIKYKEDSLSKLNSIQEKYRQDKFNLSKGDLILNNYDNKVQYLIFRDLVQLYPKGINCKKEYKFYCQNCEDTNTNGMRYRCTKCKNFNVCEKCITYISLHHNKAHSFIVKNEPVKANEYSVNQDTTKNALLQLSENNKYEYSYKKAPENVSIGVKVTNNGTVRFRNNTFICMTTGRGVLVIVPQLNPGDSYILEVSMTDLNSLEIGHYIKEICIKDDNGSFGSVLQVKVIIKE